MLRERLAGYFREHKESLVRMIKVLDVNVSKYDSGETRTYWGEPEHCILGSLVFHRNVIILCRTESCVFSSSAAM